MSNPNLTVYFRNFPEAIDNDKLEELFAKYGSIVKCFVHKSRSYGMVQFEELSSCTSAISDLNGKPPMNLYLNMAKNQSQDKNNSSMNDTRRPNTSMNETRRSMSQKANSVILDSNTPSYIEEEVFFDNENRVINVLKDPETNEIYVPICYAQNIRRFVKKIPVSNGYQDNGDLDDDTASVNTSLTQPNRKVNYDNNTHDMKIHRSFNSENDNSPKGAYQRTQNTPYKPRNHSENRSNDYSNKLGEPRQNNRSFKTGYQSPNSGDENKSRFNKKYQGNSGDNNQSRFSRRDFNSSRISENNEGNSGDNNQLRFSRTDFNSSKISENNEGNSGDNNQSKFSRRDFNSSKISQNNEEWDSNAKVAEGKTYKFSSTSTSSSFNKPAYKPRTSNKEEGDWNASPAAAEENIQKTEEKSQKSSSTFNIATSTSSLVNKLLPKNTNKVSYKTIELPKDTFTEVHVEDVINETSGWVQISDKVGEFNEIMVDIIGQELSDPKNTDPEIGKICLAHYDDCWFRAVVLTTTPKVRVRFIDYGNEIEVEGKLLELSSKFQKIPAYGIHINLANGAPCKMKLNADLKVKPISIKNNVVEVHVEHGIYENEVAQPSTSTAVASSIKSSVSFIKSSASAIKSSAPDTFNSLTACQKALMDVVQPNMKAGMIQLTLKLSDTQGVAYLLSEELGEDCAKLETLSEEVKDTTSFRPKVGDLVAAVNDSWNRAFVLSVNNGFKVAFIDFGIIKTVEDVKPLPDAFKIMPQFSCILTTSALDKFNNDLMNFKVTKVLNGTAHCQLDDDIVDFTFVPWSPKVESSSSAISSDSSSSASSIETVKAVEKKLAPPNLKLKNGDDVKIVDENDGFVFVRTKEGSEIAKKVEKYIAQYAPNAPKITKEPIVGQFIAAQYDNKWYRAVVKTINLKQSCSEILYIDYGNEEIKPFFSLKQLDEGCCEEPCSLIRIKLRNFVDKNFSKKNRIYLENLSKNNQILKATFQDLVETGVDLTTRDGKNIVDELIKMDLVPTPFQGRKELYMKVKAPGRDDPKVMHIKLEEIPLGKGEVKFLNAIDIENHTVCVCVNNPETLHEIHVELLNQMTKYVNHIAPKEPYAPIDEEIILVENRDKWYRALCLSVEDEKFTVFFIDYGFNLTVTADKMRKLPHEFVEGYNALGNFAIITGIPTNPSQQLIDRMESLFLKNETYKVNVISKDAEDNYSVVFLDVLKQLEAENLM